MLRELAETSAYVNEEEFFALADSGGEDHNDETPKTEDLPSTEAILLLGQETSPENDDEYDDDDNETEEPMRVQ